MNRNNDLHWGLVISLSIGISSCGGGSSASLSTPIPTPTPTQVTPTPTQQPPSMVLYIDRTNLYEGEAFRINAEDIGGSNVTIKQTSGPAVEILDNINRVHFQFRAPSFDYDTVEIITFEVTASNQAGVGVRNIEFTVNGYGGYGRTVAEFNPGLTLANGNGNPTIYYSQARLENIIAIKEREDGKELVFLGGDVLKRDYSITGQPASNYVFSDIHSIKVDKLRFNLGQYHGTDEFSVLQEDRIKWFVSEYDYNQEKNTIVLQDEILINQPCELVGRTSTGEDFIWVGQQNKGFSTIRLDPIKNEINVTQGFNDSVLQSVDNDRSLCFIYPTELTDELVPPNYYEVRIPDLITLDYNSNELVLFSDIDIDEQYEEITTIPLQTESTDPLTIVDVFSRGNDSSVPNYFVVLLTDGKHNGAHRLVVVSQDYDKEIHQRTYSWSEGVPTSLLHGTFSGAIPGDQYRKDIVVILGTSEHALYFDNLTPHGTLAEEHPNYAEPVTFLVGLGAGSAVVSSPKFVDLDPDNFALNDILVSFPDTGQLRLYRVHDLLPTTPTN